MSDISEQKNLLVTRNADDPFIVTNLQEDVLLESNYGYRVEGKNSFASETATPGHLGIFFADGLNGV